MACSSFAQNVKESTFPGKASAHTRSGLNVVRDSTFLITMQVIFNNTTVEKKVQGLTIKLC
jgi:hypothetical protein